LRMRLVLTIRHAGVNGPDWETQHRHGDHASDWQQSSGAAAQRLPVDQVRAVDGNRGWVPGDVVVSKPTATFGGEVRYNMEKVTVAGN
jgi:hypothetical protein